MRIAIISLVCALVGCSAIINPDTGRLGGDTGVVADGGMTDAGDMPTDDGGTSNNGDAGGPTCASLPLGDVTLAVVGSTCEGPFELAQSLSARVLDSGTQCAVAAASLRVVCDHSYQDIPMVIGALLREGTTYTSENVTLGCEGVTYMCHGVFDAATNEHHIDCSLDAGASWCVIDLE